MLVFLTFTVSRKVRAAEAEGDKQKKQERERKREQASVRGLEKYFSHEGDWIFNQQTFFISLYTLQKWDALIPFFLSAAAIQIFKLALPLLFIHHNVPRLSTLHSQALGISHRRMVLKVSIVKKTHSVPSVHLQWHLGLDKYELIFCSLEFLGDTHQEH